MTLAKFKVLALGLVATAAVAAVPVVVAYQAQQPAGGSASTVTTIQREDAGPRPVQPAPEGPRPKVADRVEQIPGVGQVEQPAMLPEDLALVAALEAPFNFVAAFPDDFPKGLHFRGLMNIVRRDSRKVSPGLPNGVDFQFTDPARAIAESARVDLARLRSQGPSRPLRVGLTGEAQALGLEYQVRGGKVCFEVAADARSGPATAKRSRDQDDARRNEAIRTRLDEALTFKFPEPVSFDKFLLYVREAMREPIPIYVDPAAFRQANPNLMPGGGGESGRSRTEPAITIELSDVPLRTALRLALRQVDLDYEVAGGVLIIGPTQTIQQFSNIATPGGMR